MSWKVHLIYCGIIAGLLLVLKQTPRETTKAISKSHIENVNQVKFKSQVIDKVIVEQKLDGVKITTTEKIKNIGYTASKSVTKDTFKEEKHAFYPSRYSVDVLYPLKNLSSPFDPRQLTVIAGCRLFDTPMFLTVGTDVKFQSINVGVRYEF